MDILRSLELSSFHLLIRYLKQNPQDSGLFEELAVISESISNYTLTDDATAAERIMHRNLLTVQRLINLVVLGQSTEGTLKQAMHAAISMT